MKTLTALTAAFALLIVVSAAGAVTIDFESSVAGTSVVEGDVTFTSTDGSDLQVHSNAPNGTKALIDSSPYAPIRADIAGGALSVSVDLGDFASDEDDLFLRAYDEFDVLVDNDQLTIPSTFDGMETLSVAGDIAYVIFGGVGLNDNSNVYADNFVYRPVPEPASLTLLALGAAALLHRRRGR